ncbi:GntR family transcriptional regulator [Phyllobacterium sp. LjRoot231]
MTTLQSAEFAAEQIRRAIIDGQYKPGDRLIEQQLTDGLGISRHPVREALRLLAREGLVEVRPNRGAIVADLEASNILEVYAIRSALGGIALRHLLQSRKSLQQTDLKRLERLAKNAIQFAKLTDQEKTIANDLEFQTAIVEASGLPKTVQYFTELNAEIQRFNNLSHIVYTAREEDAKKYVAGLLEAIENFDLPRAEAIWNEKFKVAVERFLAFAAKPKT